MNCLLPLTRYYSNTTIEEWQRQEEEIMRAVLILNPTSGLSAISTTEATEEVPQEHKATILAGLIANDVPRYGARVGRQQ